MALAFSWLENVQNREVHFKIDENYLEISSKSLEEKVGNNNNNNKNFQCILIYSIRLPGQRAKLLLDGEQLQLLFLRVIIMR